MYVLMALVRHPVYLKSRLVANTFDGHPPLTVVKRVKSMVVLHLSARGRRRVKNIEPVQLSGCTVCSEGFQQSYRGIVNRVFSRKFTKPATRCPGLETNVLET